MNELLKTFEKNLQSNGLDISIFNPSATIGMLQSFDKNTGLILPEDFKCLYEWKNGSVDEGAYSIFDRFDFATIEEVEEMYLSDFRMDSLMNQFHIYNYNEVKIESFIKDHDLNYFLCVFPGVSSGGLWINTNNYLSDKCIYGTFKDFYELNEAFTIVYNSLETMILSWDECFSRGVINADIEDMEVTDIDLFKDIMMNFNSLATNYWQNWHGN